MPFVVYVAADLYNNKVNLEVTFPSLPTLGELHNEIHRVFSNECVVLRPSSSVEQRFGILKLQLFRDADGSWKDVFSPSQLTEFAQLYVFQSDPNFQESQQQIMPARRPSPGLAPAAVSAPLSPTLRNVSPSRSRADLSSAVVAASSPSRVAPPAVRINGRPPVTVTRAPHPGDAATTQEKIRYVFEEMDTNRDRVVDTEEFRRMLRDLNVDFTAQTVGDLFRKADTDRDGVISLGEFVNFFSSYPTLLDSLYFRLKDVIESRALQQELAAENAQMDASKEARDRANAMVEEAVVLMDQQGRKITALENERQDKVARERELRQAVAQGESDLDRSIRDRNEVDHNLGVARERENQRRVHLSDSQRVVAENESRVASQQTQASAGDERVRQLQAMLHEAQLEAERLHKLHHDSQVELSQAREREVNASSAHAQASEEVRRAADQLQLADREHTLRQEKQRELQNVVVEQQADVSRLGSRIDAEGRELDMCRERERTSRNVVAEAEASVQLQERRVMAKDAELQQFAQRRAAMEQKERPLLEQEVRLREQRETLEEKELRLRRDAGTLFTDPVRVSTRRSPSPQGTPGVPAPRHLSPTRR